MSWVDVSFIQSAPAGRYLAHYCPECRSVCLCDVETLAEITRADLPRDLEVDVTNLHITAADGDKVQIPTALCNRHSEAT